MVWLDVMSDFRIIPGMSCWNEMPAKYKKAYFEFHRQPTFYEKNQQKLNKIWKKEIRKENSEDQKWMNWMM